MSERAPGTDRAPAATADGAVRAAAPFDALIEIDALQRLQDAIAAALGLAVIVRDISGAFITRPSGPVDRAHDEGCALSQAPLTPDDDAGRCPACGALWGATPILLEDRPAAWIVWSHPVAEPPSPERRAVVRDAIAALAEGMAAFARRNTRLADEVAARQQERRFLDCIVNAIADPIFVKDERHRWVNLNDAFCRFMGYRRDELLGRSDFDFFPDEEARVFWEKDDHVFATERENVNEERFTDAEGVTHTISTKKRVFRGDDGGKVLVGVIRDITAIRAAEEELAGYRDRLEEIVAERTRQLQAANERLRSEVEERRRAEAQSREMEAQLRHQQRLESIGRLAGGVAHDFNNLLTGISGHVTLATGRLAESDPVRTSLEEIGRAARAASRLTRQLLAFGRKQMLERRVVDIGALVSELRRMLGRLIGEDVALTLSVGDDPACARVDPGQIEQVVVNLAVNARDAMPEGGALAISVDAVTLDEADCRARPQLSPGPHVAVRVRDTGSGMDDATLRLAFEPFFTTKPPSQGTGLGLSTAFGIIRQHGGHIEAASTPGEGTTVTFHLPAVDDRPEDLRRADGDGDAPTGRETILLVEDEEMVREVAAVMLRQLGYEVIEASHADEALALAEQREGPIDLLLSDLIMPGLDGAALADEIVARRPGCRVLLMSGYTDEVATAERLLRPGAGFLHKPFSRETLARTVRRVLEADVPPPAPEDDADDGAGGSPPPRS